MSADFVGIGGTVTGAGAGVGELLASGGGLLDSSAD